VQTQAFSAGWSKRPNQTKQTVAASATEKLASGDSLIRNGFSYNSGEI
jgi:hypothetical protein